MFILRPSKCATKPTRRRFALEKYVAAMLAFWTGALVCVLSGCSSLGQYVWYNDLPKTEFVPTGGEYVINVGDTLEVKVYDQDGVSTQAKIRSDGRMAVPFVGEIVAVGKHPSDLTREIQARLKEFIVSPRVVVNVVQSQPVVISTLGEVSHVGVLTLENQAGLLDALALAGGFTDYADKSAIFVIRRLPEFRRIRFTYEALLQNKDNAATFSLRTGDVVLVE